MRRPVPTVFQIVQRLDPSLFQMVKDLRPLVGVLGMSDDPNAQRAPWVRYRSLPVCAGCWHERNPDRQAARVMEWPEAECIVCEEKTTDGIFVRVRVEWA
jgi:hypothetical protein